MTPNPLQLDTSACFMLGLGFVVLGITSLLTRQSGALAKFGLAPFAAGLAIFAAHFLFIGPARFPTVFLTVALAFAVFCLLRTDFFARRLAAVGRLVSNPVAQAA